jgi:hypothetical protein
VSRPRQTAGRPNSHTCVCGCSTGMELMRWKKENGKKKNGGSSLLASSPLQEEPAAEESAAEEPASEEPAAQAPLAQELEAMISHSGCPPPEDKLLALLTDMARMAASVGVVLTGEDWPELRAERTDRLQVLAPGSSPQAGGAPKTAESPALEQIQESTDTFAAPLSYEQVWHQARGQQSLWVWKARPPPGYVALGFVSTISAEPPSTDLMRCVAEAHTISATVGQQIWNDRGTGGGDGAFWSLPSGLGVCSGGTHSKPSNTGVFTIAECECASNVCRCQSVAGMVQEMTQVYNDRGSGGSANLSIWRPNLPHGCVLLGDHVKQGYDEPAQAILVGNTLSVPAAKPPAHLELAKLDLVTMAMLAIKTGASLPLPLRLKRTRTTTARLAAADIKPGMHVVCVEVPAGCPVRLAGARGVVAAEGLERGEHAVVTARAAGGG